MGNQHACMAEVDRANVNWEVQTEGPGVVTAGERGGPMKAASRASPESPGERHQWGLLSPAPFVRLVVHVLGHGDQEQQRLKGPCSASRPLLMSRLGRDQAARSQRFTPQPAAQTMHAVVRGPAEPHPWLEGMSRAVSIQSVGYTRRSPDLRADGAGRSGLAWQILPDKSQSLGPHGSEAGGQHSKGVVPSIAGLAGVLLLPTSWQLS